MELQERIDFLSSLLNRVDSWLRYAETKNGVLLTLSAGVMALVLRKGFSNAECIAAYIILYIGIFLIFISICMLISSFVPKLQPIQNLFISIDGKEGQKKDILNILYFADIAGCSKEQFKKEITETLYPSGQDPTRIEKDLIDQIHINASIATKKFLIFSPAVCFLAAGTLLSVLGILAG